jgi:hypothetical protein
VPSYQCVFIADVLPGTFSLATSPRLGGWLDWIEPTCETRVPFTPGGGKSTGNPAERLPSEVPKTSKEIPSQERQQICINWAMPTDFNNHAAKE